LSEKDERLATDEDFDHNADRYPDAATALRRLAGDDNLPEGPVEYIELNLLASGEIAWRVRPARSEELQVGSNHP
jgi:hypothetical protein